uniref:Protein-tyrosine phosphatase n=1 Tax=Strongyloides stercoralis TaxID=6248 RepID=A0A0K0E0I9_STRER
MGKNTAETTKVSGVRKDSPMAQAILKWVRRCLEKKVSGLREEFAGLKRYCPPGMTTNAFNANAERSRYKDVPAQDAYRVVLKWHTNQGMDYIHANYVASPISEKRFICCQGPMDNTIADFWHMVIQEETEVIIMLCNIIEKGQNKCSQYWPENVGSRAVYQDVEVTLVNNTENIGNDANVKKNRLRIRWKGADGKISSRDITHIHWQDWPDRGVPPTSGTPGALLSAIRGNRKPIVVHCSAGIGRTGSIVAIECVLEKLSYGKDCENMDMLLKELRSQRPYSIQNDLQYLFVHRIVLFAIFDRFKVGDMAPDLVPLHQQFIKDYDEATT